MAADDPSHPAPPDGPATRTPRGPAEAPTDSVAGIGTTGGPAAPTDAPPPAGTERYVLGAEIARGGMGVVYRATDTAVGRPVAVKVLRHAFAPTSGTARRFHDEARITGQLQHPNVPAVFDLGTLPDGRPFLAMKLIKGETLDELLKVRPAPARDAGRFVAAFEQVCQAVAYAHAHGVIHRDLKPANVMVGGFGEVQVMDWGLAKVLASGARERPQADDPEETAEGTAIRSLRDGADQFTQAGSILGTPAYMPPEQALGAVHEVDARSDVFGLGGILAAVLTGRPPFVGDTAETTRVMAARGEVGECFARLDASGADPELVALAKWCLAPKPAGRPADAGVVAQAVAELRAAADERARRAELDKVRVAGERAAAAERRKRRRVWVGAAAVLAAAAVAGLSAVLVVQDRAKRDLEAKNGQLAEAQAKAEARSAALEVEQAKVAAKNRQLEAEQAKVESRFAMARKAIATFHTLVADEKVLENDAFQPLRTKLLKEATGFYQELEGLLAGAADAKSRKSLADGLVQLGELTGKIGDQREALAVHRRALEIRRELASAPGADVGARLDVARSLGAVGCLLNATGDPAAALRADEEQRNLATALAAEAPTAAVRSVLADSHNDIGAVLARTGKPAEALAAYEKARDVYRELTAADPAVTHFQSSLANTHYNIGLVLSQTGKPADALAAFEQARDLQQQLADAHPALTYLRSNLADSHNDIGFVLERTGKPAEALASHEKGRDILQRLADANPAVTQYQSNLARSHLNIGWVLSRTGKPAEALAAYEKARDIRQRLADANPAVPQYQSELAQSHINVGAVLARTGKSAEALASYEKARDIKQKLADANPAVTQFRSELAWSHNNIGLLLAQTGKSAEALASYEKARDIFQKLADDNPTIPGYQSDLATSQNNLGRLHARERRFGEAFAAIDAGLAIRQKLAAADTVTVQYTNHLGFSHAYRGWVRVRAGQPDGAAADLRRALELWAKNPASGIETRFEKARALALLAKLSADPNSGVTADEGKGFADRAVAALADALTAGSSNLTELQEPEFDAIRSRGDFRKLMAALEAKAPKPPEVAPPPRPK